MTITLYQNLSEPHRLDKSLRNEKEYSGNLKDSSSVVDPSFMIESEYDLSLYNYCYIPEFHRFYYITGIEVIRTNMWAISCHVDVLMSFKTNIRSLSGIISRQEWQYNLYLNDDKLLVECDRDIMTLGFNNPLSSASSGRSFVLTVAGGSAQSS